MRCRRLALLPLAQAHQEWLIWLSYVDLVSLLRGGEKDEVNTTPVTSQEEKPGSHKTQRHHTHYFPKNV